MVAGLRTWTVVGVLGFRVLQFRVVGFRGLRLGRVFLGFPGLSHRHSFVSFIPVTLVLSLGFIVPLK